MGKLGWCFWFLMGSLVSSGLAKDKVQVGQLRWLGLSLHMVFHLRLFLQTTASVQLQKICVHSCMTPTSTECAEEARLLQELRWRS